jgi:hypothetical protein
MKYLTLLWILLVGGCFYVATHGTAHAARVPADQVHQAAAPAKTITAWTIVRGCQIPHHKPQLVATVVFSDGSIVVVTGETDAETKAAVQKAVGDVTGTIYTFVCGESV